MAKVMITLSVENGNDKHEFQGRGIFHKNRLTFYDQKIKTLLFLNDDEIKLIREDVESKTILDFSSQGKSYCELKNRSVFLPLACELTYIKKEERCLLLHYKVEEQLFKLYIEYEVLK